MSTITALRAAKRTTERVNLFLDGRFTFSLEKDDVVRQKLEVGLELSQEKLAELTDAMQMGRCLDAAYRLLGYRPRSESEVRTRLQRRGFPPEHIAAAIGKLKERGLLDDREFARFWVENRAAFRPRSRGLTRSELLKKGVAEDAIRDVVSDMDETDAANRAAAIKARRLSGLEYREFRQRLGDFLRRRGFTYETIDRAVKHAWEERKKEDVPSP